MGIREKGQIELETIVKLVVVLVVLVVILLFVSGGFSSMGGKLANATKDTTDAQAVVQSEIGSSVIVGSGACSAAAEDGPPNCQIVVNHPTGCATGPDISHIPPGVPFMKTSPPYYTETLCSGKCELQIKTCSGSIFSYTLRER